MNRVTKHALDVVEDKVISNKFHKLACQRHLDDLEKAKAVTFNYEFDEQSANEIINYAETLTIAEGFEKKQVQLLDTQAFDFGCLFGWRRKDNHKRRFRRSYISVARQNGKTFTNGIIGTYIAGFSGYQHGKLFTVATKKRQSRLAFEEMEKFIQIDDDLNEFFTIKDYKSQILCDTTQCSIEALSRESGLDDGFRSIFSSIDELHQHKDNKIYKALYNGTRALPETLVSMITTRGDKLNSFCKEMDDYCISILEGTAVADDFFVDIYCLDDEDDIFDEKCWIKANPFLCSTELGMEQLRRDAQTAKDMQGSDLRDFITKSLNRWVQNSDDNFINTDMFKKCGSARTLEEFRNQSCWVGLDLSSGGDLVTLALEFEEKGHCYFYTHSFMPRGRLIEHIETDLAPYDLWEQKELITVTGSTSDFKNDYKFIVKHLKELQKEFNLNFKGIGIDPHNADGFIADLEEFGCPVVIIQQSCKSLNDATVDVQLLIKSNKLEYDQTNELMIWSFVNACVVRNSFGEIKVDKKPREKYKRIDPVDACIDAHALMLKYNSVEVVDIEESMDSYLKLMGWK